MLSFSLVEKAMQKVMGTRTRHIAIPDFGFSVKAVPQTLEISGDNHQGYGAEVHIDKRTIFSPDFAIYHTDYGALQAALLILKADLQAQIDEIDARFEEPYEPPF